MNYPSMMVLVYSGLDQATTKKHLDNLLNPQPVGDIRACRAIYPYGFKMPETAPASAFRFYLPLHHLFFRAIFSKSINNKI